MSRTHERSAEAGEWTGTPSGKLGRTLPDAPADVLAGAVAHDINNVLTGIYAGLDFVAVSLADGRTDRVAEDLQQIRDAADRLLELSRMLEARASGRCPSAAAPAPRVTTPAALRGRVLVIDDEPLLVELVVQALAGAHEVVVAPSARAALAQVAAGEPFDAILCDVMLPELDGPAVYEALHAVAPALAERVVFMTGGAFTPRTRAFLAGHAGPTLTKPFGILALRAAVAEAVVRARAAG